MAERKRPPKLDLNHVLPRTIDPASPGKVSPPLPELTPRQLVTLKQINTMTIPNAIRLKPCYVPGFDREVTLSGLSYDKIEETRLGTCAVLTCVHESELIIEVPQNPYSYHLNVRDDPETDILAEFPQIAAWLDGHLDAGRPVHIQCMAGLNRSATLTLAYMCYRCHMSLVDAYAELYRVRPGIVFNDYFMYRLIIWADTAGCI